MWLRLVPAVENAEPVLGLENILHGCCDELVVERDVSDLALVIHHIAIDAANAVRLCLLILRRDIGRKYRVSITNP